MKWKEFKLIVEGQGIKDDDDIWYIDVSFNDKIIMKKDEIGWGIAN